MGIDVTSLFDRRANNRWDRCAVGDILERVALVRPDAEALVGAPGAYGDPAFARLTYRQADEFANRFASSLIARGASRGDRVMFICDNSIEAFVAKIGVAKAGCVAVPINPSQVADFVRYAVELTGPKLVVADAAFLALPESVGLQVDVTIPIGGTSKAGVGFAEFCEEGSPQPPAVPVHIDDVWQILFTSGTTAMPKGVMISHAYCYFASLSWALTHTRGLRHESHLRTACFAPIIFHIGDEAYTMPALFVGGTIILGRGLRPDRLAATVIAERATLAIASGRDTCTKLLAELESRADAQELALTCVIHGSGLFESDLLDRWDNLVPGVNLVYIAGQTESTSGHRFAYAAFPAQHADAVARTVNMIGQPAPMMVSQVVDPDGSVAPLPHGLVGELVYRSPVMMSGYYRDEEATRRAFEGGWFHSGDLGVTEPGGERLMVGRIKDMIKTGGENVAALRVESVLLRHPAVAGAAVIGLPDDRWGEMVTAVVVMAEGAEADEAEIISFCRSRLAGYETPKRVITVDQLPLDFAGVKVRKVELKRQIMAELAND